MTIVDACFISKTEKYGSTDSPQNMSLYSLKYIFSAILLDFCLYCLYSHSINTMKFTIIKTSNLFWGQTCIKFRTLFLEIQLWHLVYFCELSNLLCTTTTLKNISCPQTKGLILSNLVLHVFGYGSISG